MCQGPKTSSRERSRDDPTVPENPEPPSRESVAFPAIVRRLGVLVYVHLLGIYISIYRLYPAKEHLSCLHRSNTHTVATRKIMMHGQDEDVGED
jgi:hypothetical protein